MNKIRRTNQGGSIVFFIIVGVILAIILVAAVFIVKNRGNQARHDATVAVVEQQFNDDKVPDRPRVTPPVETNVEPEPEPEAQPPVVVKKPADLPITGPEIGVVEMLGAGLLVFCLLEFIQSKRLSVRYL